VQIARMSVSVHAISCGPPRFDETLDAWVLSRHADVCAALLDNRLVAPGNSDGRPSTRRESRAVVARSLEETRSPGWLDRMRSSALRMGSRLPAGVAVDLVADFAAPWSLEVAAMVAAVPPESAHQLVEPARTIFLAAARATSPGFPPDALEATATLTRMLSAAGGAADAQSFVALSQTLPCALSGAWHALVDHPAELDGLRCDPAGIDGAVDELLRLASPSRAVFRRAAGPLDLEGARIAEGDTVILALTAANHDPARYRDPHRFDPARSARGQLGFGRGRHGCPGAAAVRLAVAEATKALLASASRMERAGPVEWTGGFAIRGPSRLPVVLGPVVVESADAGV
jgi:cytochrome P450